MLSLCISVYLCVFVSSRVGRIPTPEAPTPVAVPGYARPLSRQGRSQSTANLVRSRPASALSRPSSTSSLAWGPEKQAIPIPGYSRPTSSSGNKVRSRPATAQGPRRRKQKPGPFIGRPPIDTIPLVCMCVCVYVCVMLLLRVDMRLRKSSRQLLITLITHVI